MTPALHRSLLVSLVRDLIRHAVFEHATAGGHVMVCRLCGSNGVHRPEPIRGHHAGCSIEQVRLALAGDDETAKTAKNQAF